MNGISFEMASCQVFIGSWSPNARKFKDLILWFMLWCLEPRLPWMN
jgi:hypothetical protein